MLGHEDSGGNAARILGISMDELCCQFHLLPPVVSWVGPKVGVEMVAKSGNACVGNLTHSHTVIAVWIEVVKSTASVGVPVTIYFSGILTKPMCRRVLTQTV
jgi:hypothetical protein